jgi:hypothetical protein
MTADKFRSLALEVTGAIESAHMGHPDFRIEGRIFATLGYPDESHGMVKLTPEQQRAFLEKAPGIFAPCNGAWGRQGATTVHLPSARLALLGAAFHSARRNVTFKGKKAQRYKKR